MEGENFEAVQICAPSRQGMEEHILHLDTAKVMAMLSRNEKGRHIRRYFIRIEKKYKAGISGMLLTGKQLMALVAVEAQKTIAEQEQTISRMSPKVFAYAVAVSRSTILIGELAKLLRQNGINTGEKRLFDWMRQQGICFLD